MGRVKIQFPAINPLFTAAIKVRIGDINYGGHVGNDAILSVIHEARMQMLSHFGFSELDAAGNGMIMADVMIAYKNEAFYGDVLEVKLYAEEITNVSFDLLYHISTLRGDRKIDIAHAKTGMVCFDYQERKIAPMTIGLKAFLEPESAN